jgi:hypothetical protein
MARPSDLAPRENVIPTERLIGGGRIEPSPVSQVFYARGPRFNSADILADALGVAADITTSQSRRDPKGPSKAAVAGAEAAQSGLPLTPEQMKSKETVRTYQAFRSRADLEVMADGLGKKIEDFLSTSDKVTVEDVNAMIDAEYRGFLTVDGQTRPDLGDENNRAALVARLQEVRIKALQGAQAIITEQVEQRAIDDGSVLTLRSIDSVLANPEANGLSENTRTWSQALDAPGLSEKVKQGILGNTVYGAAAKADADADPRYIDAVLNEKDAKGVYVVQGKLRAELENRKDSVETERQRRIREVQTEQREVLEDQAWTEFETTGTLSMARLAQLEQAGVKTATFRSMMSTQRSMAASIRAMDASTAALIRAERKENSEAVAGQIELGLMSGQLTKGQALQFTMKYGSDGTLDAPGIARVRAGIGRVEALKKSLLQDPQAQQYVTELGIAQKQQLANVRSALARTGRGMSPQQRVTEQQRQERRIAGVYANASAVFGDTMLRTQGNVQAATQAADAVIDRAFAPKKASPK